MHGVSIHAPWEGCDCAACFGLARLSMFQFTHPGKGATELLVCLGDCSDVSIHAPWEGCDSPCSVMVCNLTTFQFTHPGKGATSNDNNDNNGTECFKSRTLGRVRLRHSPRPGSSLTFQFTHPGKGATPPECLADVRLIVSIHAPWEGCD